MVLRRLLVAAAAVALLLAAGAAALWLSVRKDLADPDPAKARREVQRFYDRRSPGRYLVLGCTYSDQVDSYYDNFT